MNITIDQVWIYFKFTGGKNLGIDSEWNDVEFSGYIFPCIPVVGDIIDFRYMLKSEGIDELEKDYGTTLFWVTQRVLEQNQKKKHPPIVSFTIEPSINP